MFRIGLHSLSSALLIASFLSLSILTEGTTLDSVPDLEKAMYLKVEAYPCVRLLNLSGEIGCSNPGREKVVAAIVRLKDANNLVKPSTILVPAAQVQFFFEKVFSDQHFAQNVAGALIESVVGFDMDMPGFSPVGKFPLSEFAPYVALNYEWNPTGSAIMWNRYNFPVFLLSGNSTLLLRKMADLNEKDKNKHLDYVAEFDLVMQTTTHGTHDSKSCLEARTCLPLGGYSVWASLPPISVTSTQSSKPLILAIASMDSASFFRDQSIGADSPLSGLICLLAAADALSLLDNVDGFKKELIFMAFTGEAWGYIGSRKFLAELDLSTNAVDGLNSTLIEKVLEIGSVGKGLQRGSATFFAHFEQGAAPVNDLVSALEQASTSLHSTGIKIQMASSLNPGIPPSSLMTFLRKNSSISGVVLEEFDRAFINDFYESHLDDRANINSSSIVAAASLVARTLYILAMEDQEPDSLVLDSIRVNATLVEELIGCLLSCVPGLSCNLVKNYISASNACPNHYVGVFLDSPVDAQNPQYVDDTSHFLWNFLADKTSRHISNASACTGKCMNPGEVCVGYTSDRNGRCLLSSTRYVPAYSTRLSYTEGMWHILPVDSADPLGNADPVWTESYWNIVRLRAYTIQSSTYDVFTLSGGVALTITTYAAVMFIRAYFMKVVKHD